MILFVWMDKEEVQVILFVWMDKEEVEVILLFGCMDKEGYMSTNRKHITCYTHMHTILTTRSLCSVYNHLNNVHVQHAP